MGGFDEYKLAMAVVGLRFSNAGVAPVIRMALVQGMNPRVYVVYRQAIAILVMSPIAYFSRRESNNCSLNLMSFSLIFLNALLGVTLNQNLFFFEGLCLASSSIGTAMINLVPAITFVLASILGIDNKLNFGSVRTIAKILGTILCAIGAVCMALLMGLKLLNVELIQPENWLLGCLLIFGSSVLHQLWLILQVPASASYPDHLSLSAWMCFPATIQSNILAIFIEKDPNTWNIHSTLEVAFETGKYYEQGCIESGLTLCVQAWCVSQRGPIFPAMFNPLCTVIVTILAAVFLHEEIYTGRKEAMVDGRGQLKVRAIASAGLFNVYSFEMVPLDV
nr:WAT1-related protein At4g30420-like [Quercus suber]